MIRINLLPFREERRKKQVRHQMVGFLVFLLITAAILLGIAFFMDRAIARMEEDTRKIAGQIGIYREKADKVARIKKDLSLLDEKLAVMNTLNQGRFCQIDLLTELSGKLVQGRMWIDKITTDASQVMIQGMAFDNNAVADFIKRLETSSHYERIDLKHSVTIESAQGKPLMSFTLECRKNSHWTFAPGTTKGSENGS